MVRQTNHGRLENNQKPVIFQTIFNQTNQRDDERHRPRHSQSQADVVFPEGTRISMDAIGQMDELEAFSRSASLGGVQGWMAQHWL